jgi:predicted lipoprotein with Yx(FWY)xxD motif
MKLRFRAGGVAVVAAVGLAVAGCGSSSSSSAGVSSSASASTSAPPATASSSSASSATSAPAAGVTVGTATGSGGTYLTGASGRALYLWVADTNGKSSCSGACAAAWPPLITTGSPVASTGVTAADLGTVTRADGAKQVTYNGHPLYYFVADSKAGMTTGQGSNSFGAKWWLVAPSGAAITAGASTGATSSSSSGGGSWG